MFKPPAINGGGVLPLSAQIDRFLPSCMWMDRLDSPQPSLLFASSQKLSPTAPSLQPVSSLMPSSWQSASGSWQLKPPSASLTGGSVMRTVPQRLPSSPDSEQVQGQQSPPS